MRHDICRAFAVTYGLSSAVLLRALVADWKDHGVVGVLFTGVCAGLAGMYWKESRQKIKVFQLPSVMERYDL